MIYNNDHMQDKPKEKSILNSGENNEVGKRDPIPKRDYDEEWLLHIYIKVLKRRELHLHIARLVMLGAHFFRNLDWSKGN